MGLRSKVWKFGRRIKNSTNNFLNYYVRSVTIRFQRLEPVPTGNLQGRYVIATKNGLYLLDNSELFLLKRGIFYGVTLSNTSLLVFERIGENGRIISFDIDESGLPKTSGNAIVKKLSPGCHQIDWIDNHLYVADTYNNRIIVFNEDYTEVRSFFPLGELEHGRQSKNYAHMNSILRHRGKFYVYCHNESTKTGRNSDIIVMTSLEKVDKTIPLDDENGHNIAIWNDRIYHCDSMNCKLRVDNRVVFECDTFTRGLSISEDTILLGGSDFAKREDREKSGGSIYILNSDHELVSSFKFPAMVQEIRRLDKPDLSLSRYSDNQS